MKNFIMFLKKLHDQIFRRKLEMNDLGKYFSDERVCDIFCKHKIRFTPPSDLNDPLEFKPTLKGNWGGHSIYTPFKCKNKYLPNISDYINMRLIKVFQKITAYCL